jgi:hypothetical protein
MKRSFLIFIIGLSVLVYACKVAQKSLPLDANGQIIVNINPSSAYLSPRESLKTIHFPKGYHLDVVATEPMINDRVAIAWDGNGRMFVELDNRIT